MKIGKLDNALLEKLVFDKIFFTREEVITKPGIGEDCAVVDFGEYECVVSTDPITAAVNDIGRLAIHVSCNDIASNGIEPLGIMLTVMLPPDISEVQISEIMNQAAEAAANIGVAIIGGHTEITPVVNKPVIVSTAIGRGIKGASQSASEMMPGDFVLMTKYAGLEGTGIIAKDCADKLRGILTEEEMKEAEEMLGSVSVVKEGVIAGRIGTCGMHDITEGGVLGAVWEMCEISGTGCEIWEDEIPVRPVTKKICAHFGINYLRLISSGCMMIMVRPEKKDKLMLAIRDAGVAVECIGVIRSGDEGRKIVKRSDPDNAEMIDPPQSDEIYKVVH